MCSMRTTTTARAESRTELDPRSRADLRNGFCFGSRLRLVDTRKQAEPRSQIAEKISSHAPEERPLHCAAAASCGIWDVTGPELMD
jgi:hypothetical protein